MPVNKRVVITGMGVISSIGIGKDEFWRNLISGKSGISEVERFDTSKFPVHKAGEIKDFNPGKFMPMSKAESIGRGSQFAIAAAKLAIEDGMLNAKGADISSTGIIIGTTMGEAPSIEMIDRFWTSDGEDGVYSSNVLNFPVNNLSDNVASFFKCDSHLIYPCFYLIYSRNKILIGILCLYSSIGKKCCSRHKSTSFNWNRQCATDV